MKGSKFMKKISLVVLIFLSINGFAKGPLTPGLEQIKKEMRSLEVPSDVYVDRDKDLYFNSKIQITLPHDTSVNWGMDKPQFYISLNTAKQFMKCVYEDPQTMKNRVITTLKNSECEMSIQFDKLHLQKSVPFFMKIKGDYLVFSNFLADKIDWDDNKSCNDLKESAIQEAIGYFSKVTNCEN